MFGFLSAVSFTMWYLNLKTSPPLEEENSTIITEIERLKKEVENLKNENENLKKHQETKEIVKPEISILLFKLRDTLESFMNELDEKYECSKQLYFDIEGFIYDSLLFNFKKMIKDISKDEKVDPDLIFGHLTNFLKEKLKIEIKVFEELRNLIDQSVEFHFKLENSPQNFILIKKSEYFDEKVHYFHQQKIKVVFPGILTGKCEVIEKALVKVV